MGISRDSMHKRRATGGKKKAWRKKRKYELGRQPANTKLSSNKTVRRIRVRGGNVKWRALRLDTGNYSWGSEAVTRKTRILDVVFNASNNELVRTQTLVKSAVVQVDAAPFKQWYLQHYGVDIGRKKKTAATAAKKEGEEGETGTEEVKKSNHVLRKLEKRQQNRKLDPHIEEQFSSGRLMACISSRPGQCGRADGSSQGIINNVLAYKLFDSKDPMKKEVALTTVTKPKQEPTKSSQPLPQEPASPLLLLLEPSQQKGLKELALSQQKQHLSIAAEEQTIHNKNKAHQQAPYSARLIPRRDPSKKA
ncbi:hypothetical protein CRYUN_Cryun39dG0013800 [Craigia yunnanensis]